MSTPTPRTDAAVKLTFAAGHNTVCPNFARTLERELTALTAERDQLRAEVERLTKQAVFDGDHIHTLNAAFATRAEVTDATDMKTPFTGSFAGRLWRFVRRLGCLAGLCGGVCRDGAWRCMHCGKTLNYHDN